MVRSWRSSHPGAATLDVDTGNFLAAGGPDDDGRTDETMVRGLNAMGLDAANLGSRELAATGSGLKPALSEANFPLLSANLERDGRTGPGQPSVVLEAPRDGGPPLRIGLVGLYMAERFAPARALRERGFELRIEDHLAAAAREVGQLRSEVDAVVVLAHMALDDAAVLAREVSGIDLVLAAFEDQTTHELRREGDTLIAAAGDRGRRMGIVELTPGRPDQATIELVYLSRDIPDDPEIKALTRPDPGRGEGPGRRPATDPASIRARLDRELYVGPSACVSCHAAVVRAWEETAHRDAFESLATLGREGDPACVPCHVTGADRWAGFESGESTPELANVGCESCHGPAYNHVRSLDHRPPPGRPWESCAGCHRGEWERGFDLERDWKKLHHSRPRQRR